jgi:hypothetical protein
MGGQHERRSRLKNTVQSAAADFDANATWLLGLVAELREEHREYRDEEFHVHRFSPVRVAPQIGNGE